MLDFCFLIAPLLSCLAILASALGAWGLKFVYYCYMLHTDYCYDKRGGWAVDPWAFRADNEFFHFDHVYFLCFLILVSLFVLLAAVIKFIILWTLHGFWRTSVYAVKAPFRLLYYCCCCRFIREDEDEEESAPKSRMLPSEYARKKKKKRKKEAV